MVGGPNGYGCCVKLRVLCGGGGGWGGSVVLTAVSRRDLSDFFIQLCRKNTALSYLLLGHCAKFSRPPQPRLPRQISWEMCREKAVNFMYNWAPR